MFYLELVWSALLKEKAMPSSPGNGGISRPRCSTHEMGVLQSSFWCTLVAFPGCSVVNLQNTQSHVSKLQPRWLLVYGYVQSCTWKGVEIAGGFYPFAEEKNLEFLGMLHLRHLPWLLHRLNYLPVFGCEEEGTGRLSCLVSVLGLRAPRPACSATARLSRHHLLRQVRCSW